MTKRPSKAEMDERIVVPLDPEQFIEGVLAVKPDEEEAKRQELTD